MLYLCLQATYHSIEYALFENTTCLEKKELSKFKAGSLLMAKLIQLLEKHNKTWDDLSFIGTNQGPAPFTTLRALIATVNGIAFSKKIPLYGVDGLSSFFYEEADNHSFPVIIQNAFAGDIYFAFKDHTHTIQTGWNKAELFFEEIKKSYPKETFMFIGNGVSLHKEAITHHFGKQASLDISKEFVSLEIIAHCALKEFQKETTPIFHLNPLYLKTATYKK